VKWLRDFAILLVRGYRRFVSPWLPPACRFYPTCSEYAMQALESHGLLRGTALAIWRLARCHPFSKGGFDPIPEPRETCRTAGSTDGC